MNKKTCKSIEESNEYVPFTVLDKRVSSIPKQDTTEAFEPITPKTNVEFSMELKKIINEKNLLSCKTRKQVFAALDEIKSKNEEERRQYKREKALLEIVNSETKYVHQLETLINFFLKPTRDQKLLRPEDFHVLFGNINSIYNLNKELLEELEKGSNNIVNAFHKMSPFLKMYSVYASEFKHILHLLQNVRSIYPQFAKFVAVQETRPEVQNKLSALLITPIQRVPRYKLLLTQLFQLTKAFEEDYEHLLVCLEKIDEAADHINQVMEDHETMQRLLELQRYLRNGEPNVIKPGRKLIKEGVLIKMSTKQGPSEKLYTVLMNDIIMFNRMKKDELKVNSMKCLFIFPLSKCKLIQILDKGCLKIICQEDELILYHDQFNEIKEWIGKINATIENYLNDRRTLRKDSSSRRPVKRKDVFEYHEVGLSPGKPLKKRKLESTSQIGQFKIEKRRKPIHQKLCCDSSLKVNSTDDVIPSGIQNIEQTMSIVVMKPTTEIKTPEPSNGLFIFGKTRPDSTFGFARFLGGMGSTLKRMLGFKSS